MSSLYIRDFERCVSARTACAYGCVQGSLAAWAGMVCVGKARGGAVRQWACAHVWTLPRLYSIPRSEKQFVRFKWDFKKCGMSWCSRGDQWEFGRRECRQILCLKWITKSRRTKHSWTLTIIFFWIPEFPMLGHFSFEVFYFLKRRIALEK